MRPYIFLLACLAFASGAWSSEPKAANYSDDDPAAKYFAPQSGGQAQLREKVNALLRSNPKNVAALVHRAYDFKNRGDLPRAMRDFDAALASAPPGSVYERRVLWSRGWVNYDLADVTSALRDWQRAEQLHAGHPEWVTYSYALAYWTTQQPALALAWYDKAVDANAEWGNDIGYAERTRYWRAAQREHMSALYGAWKQHRAAANREQPVP